LEAIGFLFFRPGVQLILSLSIAAFPPPSVYEFGWRVGWKKESSSAITRALCSVIKTEKKKEKKNNPAEMFFRPLFFPPSSQYTHTHIDINYI
jgi:hypothetical protein